MRYTFEWDPSKAKLNLRNHKISFERAAEIFLDPLAVSIFDEEVSLSKLLGANKRFIEQAIPHFSTLMRSSPKEVINDCDVVVVTKKANGFAQELINMSESKIVLDLVRVLPNTTELRASYEGICW